MKLRNPARALVAVSALTSLFALTACQKADNASSSSNDGDTIKIGFITDMSGVYADVDGPAGADAIKMAIAEFGGSINGRKIEFVTADHQNKADIAASKAREWFDQQGVDMLIGGTNSATNLAMAKVAAEKKKPFIAIGAGTSRLTNEECTPYTVHYAYDTAAMARGTEKPEFASTSLSMPSPRARDRVGMISSVRPGHWSTSSPHSAPMRHLAAVKP